MVLAEIRSEVEIGQVFVDRCTEALVANELNAEQAAVAKWWCTDLQGRVIDRCLQLHGGYGYTRDFPIERINRDLRIMRIYEGSSEIQRIIISGNMLA